MISATCGVWKRKSLAPPLTVAKHVVQRHFALKGHPTIVDLREEDETVALVDAAHDRGLELLGRDHFDQHDGFDELPLAVGERLLHGALGSEDERDLG